MIKAISILCIALLCFSVFAVAETVSTLPRPHGYVDDYAGVLSVDEQRKLEVLCVQLHEKAQAQVFVVTIHSLQGSDIEPFAENLADSWKIGETDGERGILILLSIKDRRYRIGVEEGLRGTVSDETAARIGQTGVPQLKQAKYDEGVDAMAMGILNMVAAESHVTLESSH